jgi:hypothetical protein
MYMVSSLTESWYPERQSSEDRLVSCVPMGAPTEHSECDTQHRIPIITRDWRIGCQWNPVRQLCYSAS